MQYWNTLKSTKNGEKSTNIPKMGKIGTKNIKKMQKEQKNLKKSTKLVGISMQY